MLHIWQYTTYECFVKDMFANGFDWLDIEYYWRNQNEYEEMLEQIENQNKLSPEEEAEWDYIRNI